MTDGTSRPLAREEWQEEDQKEERERKRDVRTRTMSPRLSERHCRGHRCPSRHTLCWLHPGCASPGLLNPFFHSLSETLFIFLLSLLHRRVTRTGPEGATGAEGTEVPPYRVPVCSLHGYLFKKQLYSKKWFPAIWKTDRPARRWKVEPCPLV